jgi:hypothetical protein
MFEAVVNPLADVAQDPEVKARLLGGQLNAVQCPRCGNVFQVPSPLVYHDPRKELLITLLPMGINMPKPQQDKLIGDLIREVTNKLPSEQRKGYLFNPRQALTMQGLVDQVLQADGVTPEMMEDQRNKMKLVETLVQASDEDLPRLVQENDAMIDTQFLQLMTLMAQRMLAEGRADMAQHVISTQQAIVELSSVGQELIAQSQQQEETVREVAEEIRAMGARAQRADFLNMAIKYANDDQRLQALVGLARPAFDPQFFQELTVKTSQAPAAERETLENLAQRIAELTSAIDQQSQMALQESVELLQAFLSDPNPDELIRDNISLVDDAFMAVLTANIQEAERQRDIAASARLKELYNKVVTILRENMQPELRLVNDILSAPTDEDARAIIRSEAATYGERLLQMFDAVGDVMASRGDQNMMRRLQFARQEAEKALARP